ncbi:MAG TPA: LLM class F420-dependent oxidoreductase, partial [Nocardioidaceae bacterium]|nr:LLM class F420-dependent oxidoreductase [Nocardioidaceae bacterium]
HASHEQIEPGGLLRATQAAAEQAGFTAAMCSDHFAPWTSAQGQSGFAWSWLGAALATTDMPFGIVTAPGQRYHPAECIEILRALLAGEEVSAEGRVVVDRAACGRFPRSNRRSWALR